ncbi:glycosyl hydrolase family 28-related protein [Mucilaginibacter angelicae]|uniref:Glycosyl hydrolase family 28-related protein n=1 Tax=Mucilaginibacter angelicae TaxID=869718 RepID=A0ABV6LEV9_9SPHI
MTTIANYAALRSHVYSSGDESVFVQGRTTTGDGGEGTFFWDPGNTLTDNDGFIIKVSSVTTGRWKRVYDDYVNVTWFGATGDVKTVTGTIVATGNGADPTKLTCTGSNFTSADVGKKITINGAYKPKCIHNAFDTDDIPRALATIIVAVNSATEVILQDAAATNVTDSEVNYGSDNTTVLQSAINAVAAIGGGGVFFPAGKYAISDKLVSKNNTHILGESKYNSIIYAIKDGFTLIEWDYMPTFPAPGNISVKNICLWGYADRFKYQNVPNTNPVVRCHLMKLSNYQFVEIDNCYGKWSREMGFALSGGAVTITNNILENILRDGINAGDAQKVIMTGNRGRFIEDDFLAADCSGPRGEKYINDNDKNDHVNNIAIICNNDTFGSQGITVGGARNVIIANNNLSFIKGRAIRCSVETASGGQIESLNVVIANNNIKDVLKLCTPELTYGKVGDYYTYPNVDKGSMPRFIAGASADGIELGFTLMKVSSSNNDTCPGAFDAVLKQYVKPELFWNLDGLALAHGQSRGVIVAHNSIMQSLSGLTKISDAYGYGLWTRKGDTDVLGYQGTICLANGGSQQNSYYKSYGITVGGPNKGLKIINNYIYGFQRGIYFDPYLVQQVKDNITTSFYNWREDITIKDNTIERTLEGIYLDVNINGLESYPIDMNITGNSFDPDPYLEATDRSVDTTTGVVNITNISIAKGSTTLTGTGSKPFSSDDIGRLVQIPGAGFLGLLNSPTADPLVAQIATIIGDNSVTLSTPAMTDVSGQTSTKCGMLTGGWTNDAGVFYRAILAQYAVGLKVSNNNFKNTKDVVGGNTSTKAFVYSNNYYCDPDKQYGIKTLINTTTNRIFWIDSTPGNFNGQLLTIKNTDLQEAAAQPTSGYFIKNQIVRNTNPVNDANGFILYGWLRLTTGSIPTDWQPIYLSTTSLKSAIFNQTATTQTAAFKISGAGTILGGLTVGTGLSPSVDNGLNFGNQTLRWRQIWGGFGHIGDPNALDNSAMFQIDSASRGFLPVRMNKAQRLNVISPADGLLIYQTDELSGLYEYNAATSAWRRIYQNMPNVPTLKAVTASGTGSATVISIPHLLAAAPSWFTAVATNSAAGNIGYITADATNININYATAPAAGTNNLAYNISFIS